MNNDMQGEALMKQNQSKLPEKSGASQSQLTSEHPNPPRYPNTKLPGITHAQTQVLMDTYGVHPITDQDNEIFNYKNVHKERHGY